MSWKVIKKQLFTTLEGLERNEDEEINDEYYRKIDRKICNKLMLKQCAKYDPTECIDYWKICWKQYRVKFFNKIEYEGTSHGSADYIYDVLVMKQLLTIFASCVISLIWIVSLSAIWFFNL